MFTKFLVLIIRHSLLKKAAYSTVYEENQRTEWITANEGLWTVTPTPGIGG